jgi:DMSO reductase anchor subunit
VFRTSTFVAIAGLLALFLGIGGTSPSLPKFFLLASAFATITLWMRSKTWVSEYQEVFAGRLEEP